MHGELDIVHNADGSVTITHQPHGDEPSYGTGSTGVGGGSYGPLSMSTFGPTDGDDELSDVTQGAVGLQYDPTGLALLGDPYEPPEQVPVLRNSSVDFGFDDSFYSGFGPAAIIG